MAPSYLTQAVVKFKKPLIFRGFFYPFINVYLNKIIKERNIMKNIIYAFIVSLILISCGGGGGSASGSGSDNSGGSGQSGSGGSAPTGNISGQVDPVQST